MSTDEEERRSDKPQDRGQLVREARGFERDMRRYLSRMIKASDIDDVLQEVYIRLWRGRTYIDNLQAYVFTVARHLCAEWADRDGRMKTVSLDQIPSLQYLPDPMNIERDWRRADLVNRVWQGVSRTPPKCQGVYAMHLVGNTYDEISRAFGIGPSMVKKYLSIADRAARLGALAQEREVC